jgi:hypothetical protein
MYTAEAIEARRGWISNLVHCRVPKYSIMQECENEFSREVEYLSSLPVRTAFQLCSFPSHALQSPVYCSRHVDIQYRISGQPFWRLLPSAQIYGDRNIMSCRMSNGMSDLTYLQYETSSLCPTPCVLLPDSIYCPSIINKGGLESFNASTRSTVYGAAVGMGGTMCRYVGDDVMT